MADELEEVTRARRAAVEIAEAASREAMSRLGQTTAEVARSAGLTPEQLQGLVVALLRAFDGLTETLVELIAWQLERMEGGAESVARRVEFVDVTEVGVFERRRRL